MRQREIHVDLAIINLEMEKLLTASDLYRVQKARTADIQTNYTDIREM